MLSHKFLKASSLFFIFSFCCSDWLGFSGSFWVYSSSSSFSLLLKPIYCIFQFNCILQLCDFAGGRSGGLVFPSLSEFPTVYCDLHKGFGIVNNADIDIFLELSCSFQDPGDVGNLISCPSAFSKTSLNIWNSQFMYCWNLAWIILSITLLACEMSAIVQ